MDEIAQAAIRALPAGSALLATALVVVWRQWFSERKEWTTERLSLTEQFRKDLAAKDTETRELQKELYRTLMSFSVLQEKYEKTHGRSSNPPRS